MSDRYHGTHTHTLSHRHKHTPRDREVPEYKREEKKGPRSTICLKIRATGRGSERVSHL